MKFNYGLSKEYENDECEDYVGIVYKVEYTDEHGERYRVDLKNKDSALISATKTKRKNTVKENSFKAPSKHYKMLPLLRQNKKKSDDIQRDVVVIFGSSGSGKTTLVTQMCRIFSGINPDKRILYISSKNMLKDPSFDTKLYNFIPFNDFMEEFTDEAIKEFEMNNVLDNTLLIFDDVISSANTKEQKELKNRFFKFLAVVLKLKRMNYISLIYCCHEVTDGLYTKDLFNEMTIYIVFNTDLKNNSNRVLKDYLKLDIHQRNRIMQCDSRWISILTRPRAILTENEIFALN